MFKSNDDRMADVNDRRGSVLPGIFGYAKLFGLSAIHTHWPYGLYAVTLQIMNVTSLLVWMYLKNIFFGKSIYGFAWGVLHAVTTFTGCLSAFAIWTNHEKVESAVKLLNSLKRRKTSLYMWLPVFNVASLLTIILLDLSLDVSSNRPSVDYLQNFVYCFPLMHILTVSSQFVGLVIVCEQCIDKLQETAENECGAGLMNDYCTLHAATQLISDAFSVQNLFAVGSHGSGLALASYILTIAGLNYFPPTMASKKIWVSLAMSVFHFSYTLLIFKPCQSMENKCKRFLDTFYDRIPSAEIQVIHRPIPKKISFSACDFFSINFSALGSIIATLFTYQVILLLFEQAEHDI